MNVKPGLKLKSQYKMKEVLDMSKEPTRPEFYPKSKTRFALSELEKKINNA